MTWKSSASHLKNIMYISKDPTLSTNGQLSQSARLCKVCEFNINNSYFIVISLEGSSEVENSDLITNTLNNNSLSVVGYFEFDKQRYAIAHIQGALKKSDSALTNLLTERESQIVTLVASGQSNKQVASQLHISEFTVSAHLRRIFIKLNVDSRTAMAYKCASLINQQM